MPRNIALKGPEAGQVVTARLSHNGGPQASATQNDWGTPESEQSLTIEIVRSSLGIGPETIGFKVTGWDGWDTAAPASGTDFDRRRVDIDFYWNFDDASSAFRSNLNVHAVWDNANVAYGPEVAHTFDPRGNGSTNYNVTVFAFEKSSGKSVEVSVPTITVKDPLVEMTGSQIIYVDDEGIYANAPAGSQTTTTVASAITLARGSDNSTPHWIQLREGRTFTAIGQRISSTAGGSRYANFMMSTEPGYTTLAQVNVDAAVNTSPYFFQFENWEIDISKPIQFFDFKTVGPWDSATETRTGIQHLPFFDRRFGGDPPKYVMFHNVEGVGYDKFVDLNGENMFISNSFITGWRNYAAFGVYEHFACIGSVLARDEDDPAGGPKDDPIFYNNHGCARFTNPIYGDERSFCVFDACYLYNASGWFLNSGFQTPQPCVRPNQAGVAGARWGMYRCSVMGGWYLIQMATANDTTPAIQNALFDRNHFVAMTGTRNCIGAQYTGIKFRNNTVIRDTSDALSGSHSWRGVFGTNATTQTAANLAGPIEADCNTLVDYRSGNRTNDMFGASLSSYTGLLESNNINYAPNWDTPDTAIGPLDTSGTDIVNTYPGYWDQITPTAKYHPGSATGGAIGATHQPQSGSPAIGAATGSRIPYRDASGAVRAATTDQGAWEAA